MSIKGFPNIRLRRLRQNESIRSMLAEPLPGPDKFMWPVFVVEGKGIRQPIEAMPGQFRYSVDTLLEAVAEVIAMGVKSVMLFGVVDDSRKTGDASYAWHSEGIVQQAALALKSKFPELLVFTDICVCEYTSHGHCGELHENGHVINDKSLKMLAKMAVSHAKSGADGVAPSAMMDGQVNAIRKALDKEGLEGTILMSYSTKFASAMYGPFREAADSAPSAGDRKGYQADYRNWRTALRESHEDEAEGADILMVKPALFYLDVISELRRSTMLPLAAYNVSGEYSMLIASANNGWGDLKALVRESTYALKRAGTDIFISYWANQYDKFLKD
ncbi:MAG: porphobilinogen synthase [Lentisphaerae bacterium]|nr:porphobilinogen synthase [Lentisphaerota bacterium]MCP4101989.1 porphobilinogen synthase [Lentisphaerota bacterium]